MSVRFFGAGDGRLSPAMRALRKLVALGFTVADVPELVKMFQEYHAAAQSDGLPRSATDMDRLERKRVAEHAIRTMMAMGFSETEIGALAGLNPATVAHLLSPYDDRAVSQDCAERLQRLVQTVGGERLQLLLPQVEIKILDTCCDKGRSLDDSTRPEIVRALRILITNALVLSATPVPQVPGIHGFLAQVGDPENFVFLFGAMSPSETPNPGDANEPSESTSVDNSKEVSAKRRLAHVKLAEHEAEHLVQRFREERRRLEREVEGRRGGDLPNDGNIA